MPVTNILPMAETQRHEYLNTMAEIILARPTATARSNWPGRWASLRSAASTTGCARPDSTGLNDFRTAVLTGEYRVAVTSAGGPVTLRAGRVAELPLLGRRTLGGGRSGRLRHHYPSRSAATPLRSPSNPTNTARWWKKATSCSSTPTSRRRTETWPGPAPGAEPPNRPVPHLREAAALVRPPGDGQAAGRLRRHAAARACAC